jgi:hypothetical protein
MENIKLPTYSTIMPNMVFGRTVDPIKTPDGKSITATQISRLARFKVPSENDVIDFIKKAANDITSNQPLQLLLMLLPGIEVERIKGSNELSLQHLRNHCPYDLEEDRTYLEVLSGIVPTEILERARMVNILKVGEDELYQGIIKKLGRDEWSLRIRLSEEGMFPEASELEHLLDKKVRDSSPLSIEGNSKNYSDIASHARLLYNISGLMSYIRDYSDQFMKSRACLTVKDAVTCITTNEFIRSHREQYGGGASNN